MAAVENCSFFRLTECDPETRPSCCQEQDHREGISGGELWSNSGEDGKWMSLPGSSLLNLINFIVETHEVVIDASVNEREIFNHECMYLEIEAKEPQATSIC